jgi:hypothetical protein
MFILYYIFDLETTSLSVSSKMELKDDFLTFYFLN